jgi:subtilisin family serine protease
MGLLKKFLLTLFLLTLSSSIAYAMIDGSDKNPKTSKKNQGPEYVAGEVLVKFKEGADPKSVVQNLGLGDMRIERVHDIKPAVARFKKDYKLDKDSNGWYSFLGKNYKEITEIPDDELFKEAYSRMADDEKSLYRSYKLSLPQNMRVETAAHLLRKDPDVEYAEPNFIRRVQMAPNDPYYSSRGTWGQDYDDLWGLKKIQCERAWDVSLGNNVTVAVIDTGVDYNHEDLAGRIWTNPDEIAANGIDDDNNGYIDDVNGWNFAGNDNNSGNDIYGHGTHCAGTIAATCNNRIGVIGVAPEATIIVIKVFGDNGDNSDASFVRAIKYAADNGAHVLSNSWGGWGPSETLTDAFHYAHSKGCVCVAAAGNNDSDTGQYTPAGIDTVIAVAATEVNDGKAYFSNWGPAISIAAPGIDVLSLKSAGMKYMMGGEVGEKYMRASGTSMACPHVAGVTALILANNPGLKPDEVRDIIEMSSDDISSDTCGGNELNKNYGILDRVNAYKALNMPGHPDLECSITSPESGSIAVVDILTGAVDVKGTASGRDFGSYKLEYGYRIDAPPFYNWQTAVNVYSRTENGVLGSFKLPVSASKFTVILTVYDASGNYRKHAMSEAVLSYSPMKAGWPQVLTDLDMRARMITADLDRDGKSELILSGDSHCIVTRVLGIDGTNYPGLWPALSDFWDRIESMVIADFDIDDSRPDIVETGFPSGKLYVIQNDCSEVDGWGGYPSLGLAACDIDHDGKHELLACSDYSNPDQCYLKAVKSRGRGKEPMLLWSTPVASIGDILAGDCLKSRPGQECVYVSSSSLNSAPPVIYLFDSRGSQVTSVSIGEGLKYFGGACMADLDRDGNAEAIVPFQQQNANGEVIAAAVKVWSINAQTGALNFRWGKEMPITAGNRFTLGFVPIPGDIEGDGKLELVMFGIGVSDSSGSGREMVYVYDAGGRQTSSFQIPDNSDAWHSILADIDGDGILDIIVPTGGWPLGRIMAYRPNGSLSRGFPVSGPGAYAPTCLAAGDLDADGKVELSAMSQVFWPDYVYVYVWDLDAPYRIDRMDWPMYRHDPQETRCIDLTPPMIPIVSDEGGYTFSTNTLKSFWSFSDMESAIIEYRYRITRDAPEGAVVRGWTSVGNNTSVTAAGLSLECGRKYYFSVMAKNSVRLWSEVGYSDGITVASPIPSPANLTAFTLYRRVHLLWQYRDFLKIDGFIVERSLNAAGPFVPIATLSRYNTFYADAGLSDGASYYYRVRAYNKAASSGCSNTAYAAMPLPAPYGLYGIVIAKGQVRLNWWDSCNSETGFKIERATNFFGPYCQIAPVGPNVNTYTDKGLVKNKLYFYRVRAYKDTANSSYSNISSTYMWQ